MVKNSLYFWRKEAARCPDPYLAGEGVASIDSKGFHCFGGSVFALYPGAPVQPTVEFIVAFQTISDYLDNLADNLNVQEEQAIAQLHLALLEALQPGIIHSDYYAFYPYREDGGYLDKLVAACQDSIQNNPNLIIIQKDLLELAGMYSHLQTYKHLAPDLREEKMLVWLNRLQLDRMGLSCWELAAATGSTLGIFCLLAAGNSGQFDIALKQSLLKTYFPWVGGLHILLDYLIDMEEDIRTRQLNFVQYYENPEAIQQGLARMWDQSFALAQELPNSYFHQSVLQGLLSLYLSDIKSQNAEIRQITSQLLRSGGTRVRFWHWLCLRLRERGAIP